MNWDNLLNTEKYTTFQLAMCCIGGFMWVFVYAIMILTMRKHKYIEMPIFVAVGNIVWEGLWSWKFYYLIDIGELFIWFYRAWFFLDCLIFVYVLKYGSKQISNPYLKKYYYQIIALLVLFWTGVIYTFAVSGYDTPMGINTAYILNLGIAILYPLLYMRQYQSYKFDKATAWLKMLGTGIYTIALWNIVPPGSEFEHFAGPAVFCIDCFYIWMVYNWKHPQVDPLVTDKA